MFRALLCAALGIAVAACGVAQAGSFQVSPIRIELAPTRQTAVLRVINSGDEAVTVQAEVRAWSSDGERDVFGQTDDVLLNPPIFTIAAGATQFVRVGLRAKSSSAAEASYRLFLEELPSGSAPAGIGIRTLLRLSLPVFVAPSGVPTSPNVRWGLRPAGSKAVELTATNDGNAHIHLHSISLRPQGGEIVASKNLAAYLLPGQTRSWKIPGATLAAATQIELSARSDAGDLRAGLAPAAR